MVGQMRIAVTGASGFRPRGERHTCASAGMAPSSTASMSHLSSVPASAYSAIPSFQYSLCRSPPDIEDQWRKTKPISAGQDPCELLCRKGVMRGVGGFPAEQNKANLSGRASGGRGPPCKLMIPPLRGGSLSLWGHRRAGVPGTPRRAAGATADGAGDRKTLDSPDSRGAKQSQFAAG